MQHIGYAATNAQMAGATKARRRAAGYYATAAHLAAGRKLINQGMRALTVDDLRTLSTHPFFTVSQRASFGALADALE